MRAPTRYLPSDVRSTAAGLKAPTSAGAIALLAVQTLSLLLMTATVATKVWQDHMWVGFLLIGTTALIWAPELTRPRARRWWFTYVAGIFLYTLLRSYADETAIPIQTSYVIDVDHWLFFGTDPVVWLQHRLFSPGRLTPLDFAAVEVHWSFFIAPHILAILVFIWRRDLFPRYALLVVGTMYAGLLLFFLLPTTPPWLAAKAGALPEAFRIMDFVGGRVDGQTYRNLSVSLGEPNSVAAMPSIHMAVTFAMFLWARDHAPKVAPWLLAYTVIMGFSLVYLAEHYVLDLAAGVAVAYVCHYLVNRFVAAPAREPVPVAAGP